MSLTSFAVPTISGKKEQVNVRLTEKARKILQRLAQATGVSQADVLELLLRQVEKKDTKDVGDIFK